MTEGSEPTVTGLAELPAGVRRRQAWRPPALLALDALLAGVGSRTQPILSGVAGLIAWHERLSRRAEPWSGWTPLSLPLDAEASEPEQHRAGRSGGTLRGEQRAVVAPGTPPVAPPEEAQTVALSTSGTPSVAGVTRPIRRSPRPPRTGTPRASRHASSASGTRIRLAILRPPSTAAAQPPGDPAGPQLVASLVRRAAATAELSTPGFGPMLSASPSPRREVRGGFPTRSGVDGEAPTSGAARARAPSVPPAEVDTLHRPSPSNAAPGDTGVVDHARANDTPRRALPGAETAARSTEPGPIERLVERTLLPTPLPGLELRLVGPEERLADEAPTEAVPLSPRGTRGDEPAPSPPIDVNAIAEQVYQTLQRRQLFERERRGLY